LWEHRYGFRWSLDLIAYPSNLVYYLRNWLGDRVHAMMTIVIDGIAECREGLKGAKIRRGKVVRTYIVSGYIHKARPPRPSKGFLHAFLDISKYAKELIAEFTHAIRLPPLQAIIADQSDSGTSDAFETPRHDVHSQLTAPGRHLAIHLLRSKSRGMPGRPVRSRRCHRGGRKRGGAKPRVPVVPVLAVDDRADDRAQLWKASV
jgi:hypothetical protein